MSKHGKLRLIVQEDGDIVVSVVPDPGERPAGFAAAVEFCTRAGGGRSPRTLGALRNLARAMREDNADRPIVRSNI